MSLSNPSFEIDVAEQRSLPFVLARMIQSSHLRAETESHRHSSDQGLFQQPAGRSTTSRGISRAYDRPPFGGARLAFIASRVALMAFDFWVPGLFGTLLSRVRRKVILHMYRRNFFSEASCGHRFSNIKRRLDCREHSLGRPFLQCVEGLNEFLPMVFQKAPREGL
jgi:hypothetical protein